MASVKPRFRYKELLLLVPFLGAVGGALYWRRVEQVSAPNGSQMFVENVELKTALGRYREDGYSHSLFVTIDHPWPKPRFWGNCCNVHGGLSSFKKPIQIDSWVPDADPERYIASIGEIIWKHDGKEEVFPQKQGKLVYGNDSLKDGKFVFDQKLSLQKAPAKGELIFHGAYIVAGRPALEIWRPLRKAGSELNFDMSRDTGGSLSSITAEPWIPSSGYSTSPTGARLVTTGEIAYINLHLRGNQRKTDGNRPLVYVYDTELVDGKGKVTTNSSGGKFSCWGGSEVREELPEGEIKWRLMPQIDSSFSPPNPLILRGKVSIDNNWPMPFSVKLKPHY